MKVNLTIGDRFTILSMLPVEGNFATLKLLRKLREMLSLTQEEINEYEVKQIGDQITWSNGVKTTEMIFGDYDSEMVRNTLKNLDDEEKLGEAHYSIYEQFMEG